MERQLTELGNNKPCWEIISYTMVYLCSVVSDNDIFSWTPRTGPLSKYLIDLRS